MRIIIRAASHRCAADTFGARLIDGSATELAAVETLTVNCDGTETLAGAVQVVVAGIPAHANETDPL